MAMDALFSEGFGTSDGSLTNMDPIGCEAGADYGGVPSNSRRRSMSSASNCSRSSSTKDSAERNSHANATVPWDNIVGPLSVWRSSFGASSSMMSSSQQSQRQKQSQETLASQEYRLDSTGALLSMRGFCKSTGSDETQHRNVEWVSEKDDARGVPSVEECCRSQLPVSVSSSVGAQTLPRSPITATGAHTECPDMSNGGSTVEQPPSSRGVRSVLRGGLERLFRLPNWQNQQKQQPNASSRIREQCNESTEPNRPACWELSSSWGFSQGYGNTLPQQRAKPYSSGMDTSVFSAASPEVRAHMFLLLELEKMRHDVQQLQQRQPSIVIQNHTAVAAKAEAPHQLQELRDTWWPQWLRSFFASRLNRLLVVFGIGLGCFMLLEHWRHSWRMAQLRRRVDSNIVLRSFQLLEESIGMRRI